jgi:hypothetical protein
MSTAATVTANHNANPASEWERQVPEAERLVRVIHPDATLHAQPLKKPTAKGAYLHFLRPATKCPYSGTVHSKASPSVTMRRNDSGVSFYYHCFRCKESQRLSEISAEEAKRLLDFDSAAKVFHSDSADGTDTYIRVGEDTRLAVPVSAERGAIMLAHAYLESRKEFYAIARLMRVLGHGHGIQRVTVVPFSPETARSKLAAFYGPLQTLSEALATDSDSSGREVHVWAVGEFLHKIRQMDAASAPPSPSGHGDDVDDGRIGTFEHQLYSLAVALGRSR